MNNDWSLRLLGVGRGERPSGWGGSPLPGRWGGTRAKRGKTCGVPGPLFQPRVREPPDRRRGVRRLTPASLSAPYRCLAATVGAWAPHPPGCYGHRGGGWHPSQLEEAGRWTLRASPPGPSTATGVPGAHTRPIAWVSVSFPLATPPTVAPGLSSPAPITPPLYHPVPLPLSNAFSRPASWHRLRGPATFLTFIPSLGPCGTHPQVPLLHPPGLSFQQSPTAPPCPLPSRLTFSLHSFMAGTHAIGRGCTRSLCNVLQHFQH